MIILTVLAAVCLASCACQHEWLDATCMAPQTCTRCQETQGEALGHDWLDATCTDPQTCTRCQETQGEALGHDWLDATCTDPQICARCQETQGEALGHDWLDAACTDPQICARCQETQGEALGHDWLDATCTDPQTCARCQETQGEALGHDWQEATCTDPQTCTRCGQSQGDLLSHKWKKATCTDPKTCADCGKTSGSALGHKWQAATCITPKLCTVCGKISGRALGHTFPDGEDEAEKLCTVCGRSVTTKYVALTFDDGPSGDLTLKLLKGLEERGVKSTFFVCGYRIKSYSNIPQIVLDYGHELALHTETHANLTKLSAEEIREELQKTLDRLPEGYHVTLMRPPGGNYNKTVKQVCADMGLAVILWSLDTRDWETNDVDKVVNKIVNNVKDGDVILMHELKSSSIEAALKAIDILKTMGYEFVTVSELAAINGRQLEAGEVYTHLR